MPTVGPALSDRIVTAVDERPSWRQEHAGMATGQLGWSLAKPDATTVAGSVDTTQTEARRR